MSKKNTNKEKQPLKGKQNGKDDELKQDDISNKEEVVLSEKAKKFGLIASITCLISGAILIISSILQVLFDLNVIKVSDKFSFIFNTISICVVVLGMLIAMVFYRLLKKESKKERE